MLRLITFVFILSSICVYANAENNLYSLEKFTVFVKSNRGPKMLQAKIELELTDKAVGKNIKANMPTIRHDIRNLLGKYSQNGYWGTEEVDLLRQDILLSINRKLNKGKVQKVHFTEFNYR